MIDMTLRPKLYYPNVIDSSIKVCIAACWERGPMDVAERLKEEWYVCEEGTTFELSHIGSRCWEKYPSKSVQNRCIPSLPTVSQGNSTVSSDEATNSANKRSTSQIIWQDIWVSKWVILVSMGGALLLSFGYLVLVRKVGGFMVWLTVSCLLLFLGAMTALLFIAYLDDKAEYDSLPENEQTWAEYGGWVTLLVLFFVFLALTILAILVVIVMRRRILLAVAIVKEAGLALIMMPQLVLFPLILFAILLVYLGFWFTIGVYLSTAGLPLYDDSGNFQGYETTTVFEIMQYYHVFALLWGSNFVIAVGYVTTAGAISSWYFTREPKLSNMQPFPVLNAWNRAWKYHIGSMAFGSFILSLIQFMRFALNSMKRQLTGAQARPLRMLLACVDGILRVLEKILQFLCKNAYIMLAMHGESFWSSGARAFKLILRNILRVAAVDIIGDFLILLGKIFIVLLVSGGAFAFLKYAMEDVVYIAMPLLLIMILTFFVASAFLAVLNMAIDTLIISFLVDEEQSAKNKTKPYAGDSLMEFINSSASAWQKRLDKKLSSKVNPA